jgi:uncharacterized protein YjbJ (UPF0337 family)
MNWDRVEGNWKQFTGKVKEKWGKLTEDDLTVINGKQDQLVGRIQERYGVAKDEAQKQVNTGAGAVFAGAAPPPRGEPRRGRPRYERTSLWRKIFESSADAATGPAAQINGGAVVACLRRMSSSGADNRGRQATAVIARRFGISSTTAEDNPSSAICVLPAVGRGIEWWVVSRRLGRSVRSRSERGR